jgi:glycogen synthase
MTQTCILAVVAQAFTIIPCIFSWHSFGWAYMFNAFSWQELGMLFTTSFGIYDCFLVGCRFVT